MAIETITIYGQLFNIPVPSRYDTGSAIELTEGESNSIAQTFCENVRNNMAVRMKKREGVAEGEKALPEELVPEWQQKVNEYALTYGFGTRAASGTRVSYDPETRAALTLIRPNIKAAFVEKYGANHGRTAEHITEAALMALKSPQGEPFRRQARNILRLKKATVDNLLEGLAA